MRKSLSPAIADAHEQLLPRVCALLRQVERIRKPETPVSPATLDIARTLFARARGVLGRQAPLLKREASADLASLGVALSQLQAALEAFEAAHSGLDARLGCVAWRFPDGTARPVSRLRPSVLRPGSPVPGPAAGRDAAHADREHGEAIARLYARMSDREAEAYASGYRDGRAGRPPTPPARLDARAA